MRLANITSALTSSSCHVSSCTNRLLELAQKLSSPLLLIRVPTPHGQHGLEHICQNKRLLRAVRRHDAQCVSSGRVRSGQELWGGYAGRWQPLLLPCTMRGDDKKYRPVAGE